MTLLKYTATSAGLTTAVTAYTDGDQVGELLTFSGPDLPDGARFEVKSAVFTDAGDVLAASTLWLFRGSVTPAANNAAFALADADLEKLLGTVVWATADTFDAVNGKCGFKGNVGLFGDTSDGAIYGLFQTKSGNAVFTAVTDVKVTLYVEASA